MDHPPGDPAGSLLVERIKLSEDDDGVMPPRGERLTEEEILIIEQWTPEREHSVDQAKVGTTMTEDASSIPRRRVCTVEACTKITCRRSVSTATVDFTGEPSTQS